MTPLIYPFVHFVLLHKVIGILKIQGFLTKQITMEHLLAAQHYSGGGVGM